jgi:hypothetical protein
MFITNKQIEQLREECTHPVLKKMIGASTEYWSFIYDPKEETLLCGMTVVIVGMRQIEDGNPGDFYVDLAVATPIAGVYSYMKDLKVFMLSVKDKEVDGVLYPDAVIFKHDEYEKIEKIVLSSQSRTRVPHLRLVPKE